jgi:RimJ/RimL family protein N-acetyltransferase
MRDALFETEIRSERLLLSQLQPHHANELFPLLDDDSLHTFIGGTPLALEELRGRYEALASRHSPDGTETWLNWIVCKIPDRTALGLLEATVARRSAFIAWVIGSRWQGRGYATEAAQAVVQWLLENLDVDAVVAHIHPEHVASERVAAHAGLTVTGEVVDGERVWRLSRSGFRIR